MAESSLNHSEESPPVVRKGHGTAVLGPSDTSDSGSDIQGGPGLNRDDGLMSPSGNTSDPDVDGVNATAGPDIGDANLDSDTDSGGTGERAAAGRDSTVATDRLLRDTETDDLIDPESVGDDVDSEGSARGEVVGSERERDTLIDDDEEGTNASGAAYRPASAGQDISVSKNPEADPGEDSDVPERDHARADGRHVSDNDDIPVFDRAGRDDMPNRNRDDTLPHDAQ